MNWIDRILYALIDGIGWIIFLPCLVTILSIGSIIWLIGVVEFGWSSGQYSDGPSMSRYEAGAYSGHKMD